jgi:NADPH2:quinone reductase
MKAWVVRELGKQQDMEFADVPIPVPGPCQVLVRVASAGLNFLDTLMIQGLYQVKPPLPFTPGVEVAGTVAETGAGSRFRTGERVLGSVVYGGFAEYAVVDDARVVAMPDSMTAAEGSTFSTVYPTSYAALRYSANMRAGEVVLVHGGAGGVGVAAIQLAKAWGGKVIATAGGPKKTAICRDHGADLAIDYLSEPWLEKVKEFTAGRGADIVFDPVGGDVTDLSLRCLAWCGRLLIVGFAGGRIPAIPVNRLLLKSASAIGVLWGDRRDREPELAKATFAELFSMYARGEIKPVIYREYPLSSAPQALLDLASRQTYGKAVLVP